MKFLSACLSSGGLTLAAVHLAPSFETADGSFKKTAHTLEQNRRDIPRRRGIWFDGQVDLDPQKLVFSDETSLSTKMAHLRGRALRGERCRAGVLPHGHRMTTTLTGALRLSGMTAPFVYWRAERQSLLDLYIAGAGAKLIFLPPYSPDFNSIENGFSMELKVMPWGRAEREIEAVWDAVGAWIPASLLQNARTTSRLPDMSRIKQELL